jgi:hypothetical protein
MVKNAFRTFVDISFFLTSANFFTTVIKSLRGSVTNVSLARFCVLRYFKFDLIRQACL